jgi:hypothetical protein
LQHHPEPKTAVVWKEMISKIGLQKTISLNKYTKTERTEEWDLIGSKRFLHTTYGPSTLYSDNSAARYSIQTGNTSYRNDLLQPHQHFVSWVLFID